MNTRSAGISFLVRVRRCVHTKRDPSTAGRRHRVPPLGVTREQMRASRRSPGWQDRPPATDEAESEGEQMKTNLAIAIVAALALSAASYRFVTWNLSRSFQRADWKGLQALIEAPSERL